MKYTYKRADSDTPTAYHATILPELVFKFGFPGITMAEVGVWQGNSLKLYIHELKRLNGKVYLIDWWKGSKQIDQGLHMEWKEDPYEDIYQQVLDIIEEADAKENVVILKGDCVEMAKQIKDGELDLCFIDSDHSYEGCKKDIETYLPKIKKGGMMAGDDMDGSKDLYAYLLNVGTYTEEELSKDYVEGKGHPGVVQAVWDVFEDNVNPFCDGWYTFVGYKIVRAVGWLVDEDHAEYLTSTDPDDHDDYKQLKDIMNNIEPLEGGIHFLKNMNPLNLSLLIKPTYWKK
jgi:hypothetical protein